MRNPADDPDGRATVLLAEPDDEDGAAVERYLAAKGYRVRRVRTGREAVDQFRAGGIDVCLLHVQLPELGGHEAGRIIKSECGERFVPVLFVAPRRTLAEKIAGFNQAEGDADVTKPYDLPALHAEIRALSKAKHHHDQLVSERSHFERLSLKDPLTGLYTQSVLIERLQHELARARRYKHDLSVCVVRVDDLESVDARYGHAVADRLLKEVAHLLRDDLREVDLMARHRGTELVCILPCTPAAGAIVTAERLRATIEGHRFTGARVLDPRRNGIAALHDASIQVNVRVGTAATVRGEATTPEAMLAKAYEALPSKPTSPQFRRR